MSELERMDATIALAKEARKAMRIEIGNDKGLAWKLALVALTCLTSRTVADDGSKWRDKVAPSVLRDAQRGPVEFIVFLDAQADLRSAALAPNRAARGRFVQTALQEVASRTQPDLTHLLGALGLEHRSYWIANMIWVRGDLPILERLARRHDVRSIDANPAVPMPQPMDVAPGQGPMLMGSATWNVERIHADQVWQLGFLGDGVVIGGQDTGYEWSHPALIQSYRGWNGSAADHDYNWHDAIHSGGGSCGADSPEPCDDYGHGTHTMGIMVGDDGGTERIGVSPGARWIGCRNMDQGIGTPATYSECFQWFVAPTDLAGQNPDPSRAPHVVNNSWGCPPFEGCSANALRTVVDNTRAAGIVVVTAAGNGGSACSTIDDPPAIYESSFSVGATNASDGIAGFSSRGPVTVDLSNRLKPDVSAPGVGVLSSVRNGAYGSSSGTSMAAPHVAGVVALLLDARPDLTGRVDEIEALVERAALPLTSLQSCGDVSGGDVPNNTFGYGRVDALETIVGDADEDGSANLDDCRPADEAVWASPGPARELMLGGASPTLLSWTPPAEAGATAVTYDLLRSSVPHDFSAATCLIAATSTPAATDGDEPAELFCYLVRASNPCGGNLGSASNGAARTGADCP